MRILLVDDSAAYFEEFAMLLAESGVQYSALDRARNAAEADRLLASGAYDIYVIDYRLPGQTGLELIHSARAKGVHKPIIVLTAYDHPAVDAAAEDAGANDYLRKGDFTPALLGRAIRYALRNAASVEAARGAELRFTMAQEAAAIGLWDWDIRNQTVNWSPQQYRNFGLDPGRPGLMSADASSATILPDDLAGVMAATQAALDGDETFSATFRVMFERPSDGAPAVHWISAKGRVLRDGAGEPTNMVGVSIDITDQQNALTAVHDSRNLAVAGLEVSEMRFKTYFDSAPESLFHVRVTPDRQFVYEAINPAGLQLTAATPDAVRGRTPEQVLGAEAGGIVTASLRRVLETGLPFMYEPTFNRPSGAVVFDAIYMPICNKTGDVVGILGSARDVTEQRRLEASLRQSQKMEALGQLASGVAHDFNNLLTGMLGCLEFLGRHVTSGKGLALIGEGRRTVERGTSLTSRLLAFSREQPMTTQPVDLNAAIHDMTDLLARTLDTVLVAKQLAPDLWPALADRNQIELAILNLAINARDAMPSGGSVSIETRNETLAPPQPDGLAPGDYVTVTMSDTGSGMSAAVLARALDPFFTTKEPGRGTGLGLSMVYGMVRQLGGGLRIASEPGQGTAITLYMPRASGRSMEAIADPQSPARAAAMNEVR